MKTSLLHALMQITILRDNGDVNSSTSPKLIGFFQTLYALSSNTYRLISKNVGGYNEKIVQRLASKCSPDQHIINCQDEVIKSRA